MADEDRKDSLSPHQKFNLYLHIIDRVTSIMMLGLKVVVWIAFFWTLAVIGKEWAGKYTKTDVHLDVDGDVNVLFKILSEIDLSTKWAWAIAVISVLYGLFERKLRQRKTNYFQDRIVKLERQIDPERSSSELLPTGETRKEDRL